jgi:hypothetical protein
VNIHTRLVGALDAIILSTLVTVMVAMMLALLGPPSKHDSHELLGRHATVTIEQLA